MFKYLVFILTILLTGTTLHAQDSPTSPTASRSLPVDEALGLLEDETLPLETRISAVQSILERHPENAEVWAVLGELRKEAGQDEGALMALERAVAKDPTLHSSWHLIGILKKREQRDLDGALEAFENSLKHGGPRSVLMNEMAVTLAQMGQMEKALEKWESAIDEDPEWGVLYANAVKAALALNKEERARMWVLKSFNVDRFEEQGLLVWADYLVRERRVEEALDTYIAGLDYHPDNYKIQYYYGATLEGLGRGSEALPLYEKALVGAQKEGDIDTQATIKKKVFALKNPDVMQDLQQVQNLLYDVPDNAKKYQKNLEKAYEIVNPIAEKHASDLWEPVLMRGAALRGLGEYERARQDFEWVLEQVPGQPNALINLALLARERRDYYHAVEQAKQAVAASPRDPFIIVNAGFIMADTYNCDVARDYLETARDILPDDQEDAVLEPLEEQIEEKCS